MLSTPQQGAGVGGSDERAHAVGAHRMRAHAHAGARTAAQRALVRARSTRCDANRRHTALQYSISKVQCASCDGPSARTRSKCSGLQAARASAPRAHWRAARRPQGYPVAVATIIVGMHKGRARERAAAQGIIGGGVVVWRRAAGTHLACHAPSEPRAAAGPQAQLACHMGSRTRARCWRWLPGAAQGLSSSSLACWATWALWGVETGGAGGSRERWGRAQQARAAAAGGDSPRPRPSGLVRSRTLARRRRAPNALTACRSGWGWSPSPLRAPRPSGCSPRWGRRARSPSRGRRPPSRRWRRPRAARQSWPAGWTTRWRRCGRRPCVPRVGWGGVLLACLLVTRARGQPPAGLCCRRGGARAPPPPRPPGRRNDGRPRVRTSQGAAWACGARRRGVLVGGRRVAGGPTQQNAPRALPKAMTPAAARPRHATRRTLAAGYQQ